MRKIKKVYEVYDFEELSKEAQGKAIEQEIHFMIECTEYEQGSPEFRCAIDKAEAMHTPWFTGSYVYDYCKQEIIDTIKLNGYTYLKDGKMFNE